MSPISGLERPLPRPIISWHRSRAGVSLMAKPSVSERPLTGPQVLVMLVAFFGVVIGVNVTMMKLAIGTLPGTDVDSAYTASLGYEKEIAAAHDQNARDWRIDAHIQRGTDGGATVQVEAHDNSGRPMTGLKFQGRP